MDDLPLELKEHVLFFCDGESLIRLEQVNYEWRSLVEREDKRRNLFKRCLKREINKNTLKDIVMKMYPKRNCLHAYPFLYKSIFYATARWKHLADGVLSVIKISCSFTDIIDLKTAGNIILVGDKRGLYLVNAGDRSVLFYRIGRVKNIELYCTSSSFKDENFGYDAADITTENNIHHFYNLKKMVFKKTADVHENKNIKYCNGKSIELKMNRPRKSPVIKVDFFEDSVVMMTKKKIIQPGIIKVNFDSEGARAWCLWHSKLVICAKDQTIHIFSNKQSKTLSYEDFSPVTSIYYYANWLLLGSKYGSIYGYSLKHEEILSLNLKNFDFKLDLCTKAIIKIDAIENEKKTILVVATNNALFLLSKELC